MLTGVQALVVVVSGSGLEPEAGFSGIDQMLGADDFLGISEPGIQASDNVWEPPALGS